MTTIAAQIMTASPPVAALRAEPFTLSEMDTHPDAARIWATMEAVKAKLWEAYENGYELGEVL